SGDGPSDLTAANGALLFFMYGAQGGEELWKTDGTPAGTSLVAHIDGYAVGTMAVIGRSILFFVSARSPLDDQTSELWKSDGTPAGTGRVTTFTRDDATFAPDHLVALDGAALFTTTVYVLSPRFTVRHTLWRSDGTAPGTSPVVRLDREGFSS